MQAAHRWIREDDRETAARARLALDAGSMGGWDWDLVNDTVRGDSCWQALLGFDADTQPTDAVFGAMHPDDAETTRAALRRGLADGDEFAIAFRVVRGEETTWVEGRGSVTQRDADGRPLRAFGVNWDATREREQAEQKARLVAEMDHRVKNSFAVIEALLSLGKTAPGTKEDFAEMMRAQVHAMADAHALTTRVFHESGRSDVTVPVESAIRTALAPWMTDVRTPNTEIEIAVASEPAVEPRHVAALTMLLSELATNAMKYGALGPEGGRLTLRLVCEPKGSARLDWQERPASACFTNADASELEKGFGSVLIQHCAAVLQGEVDKKLGSRGLDLSVRFPIAPCTRAR